MSLYQIVCHISDYYFKILYVYLYKCNQILAHNDEQRICGILAESWISVFLKMFKKKKAKNKSYDIVLPLKLLCWS